MSKRELSGLIGTADVEGSRPKRRRDATALPNSSPHVDVVMSEATVEMRQNGNNGEVGVSVTEQGLELWLTVKEAKSTDGRPLSVVFLTKPPRKVYPDYYQIIQRPIALDDIKKRLDTNAYPSMQVVRADFELLFNNALEYNMKDSVIWKDAKDMLKLVHRTYEKLVPTVEGDDGSDDDERKGKSKTPNLSRMIKSRLQKLIEKTDKDGRVMSTEFMELPNKKQWAIYYKQIKKPQCLENIFRRIKRKEYHTVAAFVGDVELVFSNAMAFNQDHTLIWEDALALRDYFRQLMSDLPPPHNVPEYSNKVTNKIKIKPPVAPSNTHHDATASKTEHSSSTLRLRVPAASFAAKASRPATTSPAVEIKPLPHSMTPATSSTPNSSATSTAITPLKAPVAPQLQPPAQQPSTSITQPSAKSTSATPQPVAAVQQNTFTYSHYTHSYQPVPPPAPVPSVTPAIKTAPAASNSPAPVSVHPNHRIRFVKVRIQPQGRLLWLDHREGVKTWALRLSPGETGVNVDELVFVGDEDDEGISDEEEEEDFKQEEEEDDMDVDGSASPTKNGRIRKGKMAVRRSQRAAPAVTTRTTRSAAAVAKNKVQEKKKEPEKVEEVQLKLNGVVVKEKEDTARQWGVNLPVGSHILEVGEKGGLMWKVYIERIAD